MSVLSNRDIQRMVDRTAALGQPLIAPFDVHALEGASYDMRLGALMVVGGKPRTLQTNDSHTLEPGDFVVLTTLERLWLPTGLVGHNGIMSPWARAGLVSLFSPQIDPGFVGPLEVPVFNAGDAPIILIPGHRMFTVELVRMSSLASVAWVDKHGPNMPPNYPLPPSALRPNLRDVQDLRNDHDSLQSSHANLRLKVGSVRSELDKHLAIINARLDTLGELDRRRTGYKGLTVVKWQLVIAVVAVVVAAAIFFAGIWYEQRQNAPAPSTDQEETLRHEPLLGDLQ